MDGVQMYKLRTMFRDQSNPSFDRGEALRLSQPNFKLQDDPRVTRLKISAPHQSG